MRRRNLRARGLAIALLSAITISTSATELSSFQAGDSGWHLGTLAVGQLDSDSQLEIVVPYRSSSGGWFLDAFKPDGTRLPGFPFAGDAEINVSPTLYDLDGDGRDEIIFTCGARVIALRGNGTVFWSSEVNRSNYVPNSGFMTVTNGFYWSNGGALLPRLPETAVFSSQVSSPIVADFAGNGQKQIVTAWKIDPDGTSNDQDFNPFINDIWGSGEWGTMGETWSGGVVFLNAANGTRNYTYHFHQLVESGLALGHADTNAALETYVLNDSDSVVCFDKTKPHGLYGSGNLHGQFGKNQRLMSGSYQLGVDVSTADVDGDGLDEVLVPTTQLTPLWQPNETILDDDGAILWREWKNEVSFPVTQWQNNACMIPVNPDHDNHLDVLSFTHSFEIGFRYWNGVELVNRPGWPKNFYPYLPTPPVVGDVDGDGQEEIVIGTYNPAASSSDGGLYVFSLDGVLKFSRLVPGGLKHIPTIANVYGNGLDVVYRSLAGRVYIENFGSRQADAVSWATHRGNAQRDGNLNAALYPAGTPIVTGKESAQGRATFSWKTAIGTPPLAWRIYRAEKPEGPFTHLLTMTADARSFTDSQLRPGCQYIYEVAAVYANGEVPSVPFAVLSAFNGNLLANSSFEENSESHWDKWFTGDIDWTNMISSTNVFHHGRKSLEVRLRNSGNNGSVSQNGQYGTPTSGFAVTPGKLYSFGGFFKSGGILQPTEHWFEWSSTKTAQNTNDRPARPFPNYFTPHFTPGTNATDWTYANRTFVMPDGFPNAELVHWFTTAAPASGSIFLDDLFFRELPDPNSSAWTELIPFGATWRFSASNPGANWFSTLFNDLFWALGTAKFGAGGGPAHIVTPLPPNQSAYYFRRTFVLPALSCEELLLAATCTDAGLGLEIYLNGTKLETTGIDATSGQGNEVRYYDLAPFVDLLKPGLNTIAIKLNNALQAGWDDVAFDVSLKTITRNTLQPSLAIANVAANPNAAAGLVASPQIGLNITVPPNTIWRVESTDEIGGPWQLMQIITNTTAESMTLSDIGQNGRAIPSPTGARFYRLKPN
ncbi:MAG TPA: hypothetical protein VFW05_15000 [Verrucomicrobiae bacterium]|nr:hypothetical protein [Verrucomicrobiae bacterium]